jgi:protein-tyrosine phosphatase
LLLDYLPGHEGKAVADPYYGDDAGFETTWLQVKAATEAFAKTLP